MAKFQSPLLGYNNNVRYQGRVFHIQTEDSGVNHPHIITHLFMDGGRILKSVKTSYAQHLGADGMSETVRVMMKDQHKAMVVALKEGQFDSLLDGGKRAPDAPPSQREVSLPRPVTPAVPMTPVAPPTPAVSVTPAAPVVRPTPAAMVARLASVPPADTGPVSVQVSTERRASGGGQKREEIVHAAPLSNGDDPLPPDLAALLNGEPPPAPVAKAAPVATPPAPAAAPAPAPKRSPSVRELTLDFDALERDAGVGSAFSQQSDLPPPPKNLFTKEPRTAPYRAVEDVVPSNRVDVAPATTRTPTRRPPSMRPQPPAASPPARPVPAATAAASGPKTSLFSDDLVSDQSLDEVILSYLAEDLEPRGRK